MSSKDTQQYLICPITLKLFNDPVLAEDGYTYEREAITQWIVQHGTSPRTKKPLRLNKLTPNNEIKNTVEAFKQTSRIDYGENHQSLENLDVLCIYCGLIQKFHSITNHKLRCPSNPDNIQKFQIDDENIFTVTSTNKSSNNRKIFSFHNPLARQTPNTTNIEISLQTPIDDNINLQLSENNHSSLFRNRRIKYFFIILLILILTGIIITLAIFYIQCKEQHPTTGGNTTISILISTLTTSLISTSASSLEFLCPSAAWVSDGITIASNLFDPYDIAIDSEDNLIVADTQNRRLLKYFSNGTNVTLVTNTKVSSIFIDQFDNIYFTDLLGDHVKKLSSYDQSITIVAGEGGLGTGLNQLRLDGHPSIYVDQNETLYISDTGNGRIMKYYRNSTSGIIVAGGHGTGPNPNQLNTPYGIYVDEIDEIGAIYICDKQNHRIQKWLNGANQGITVALNNDQLYSPMSILIESTSKQMIMYVSSYSREQIFKWIPNEEQSESIVAGLGSAGNTPDRLFGPTGIKFDRYWNLFIADSGNGRIQKFLFNISSCAN